MPPKAKCSREQIIRTAFQIVRRSGMSALSARSLAKALGTSTGPVFTCFDSLEEVQTQVVHMAKQLYAGYIQDGLKQIHPFKGVGMNYIQFAKDEPELFKLLFMSGDETAPPTHFLPTYDDNAHLILDALKNQYGISHDGAKRLYNHMSVYAFGFASLYAQKIYMFTIDDISQMMSELFPALLQIERKDTESC